MTRQKITFRLSLTHSAPRTRHAPHVRHFWTLGRRLLPARFVVRRGSRYGMRRAKQAWSVLGICVRCDAGTSRRQVH
jgi:hypothetical protein